MPTPKKWHDVQSYRKWQPGHGGSQRVVLGWYVYAIGWRIMEVPPLGKSGTSIVCGGCRHICQGPNRFQSTCPRRPSLNQNI